MGNGQVKIQSIREVSQSNPATQKLEPYMVVTFMVGAHGPFQESFQKAGFDPTSINTKLMDFASKIALVQGQ